MKKCKSNKLDAKNSKTVRVQADAQNVLLSFKETDSQLIKEVFPRMAPDEISRIAKTDSLIKLFGSRYLKCHKEKHLINVVSQKIRILARFLIQVKIMEPSINSLQDCLNPKYFEIVVQSTKQVAGYDLSKDKFGSPSVILKIRNSLNQCCDIAECNILKESSNLLLREKQCQIR